MFNRQMFQRLKTSLNGIGNLYTQSKGMYHCTIIFTNDFTISKTINTNVVAKYILAACFRNRYPCIKIMQYQSLHKFTLNSITEQEIMSWNVFVGWGGQWIVCRESWYKRRLLISTFKKRLLHLYHIWRENTFILFIY